MFKLLKIKAKEVGLAPGTLVHVGEQKIENPELNIIDYAPEKIERLDDVTIEECTPLKETSSVSWINLYGLHDIELINKLGENFGIHKLALEDILNTGHRSKFELFDDYVVIILKMLSFDDEKMVVNAEQFSFVFGKNYVLSFQERRGDVFNGVRERLQRKSGRIRNRGADYLVYALIDSVVDSYFHILEKIGDQLTLLEQDLIHEPTQDCLNRIYHFKNQLLVLRKSIWPLREVIAEMQKEDSALFDPETRMFLRDLYDHSIQVMDTVEIFRDTVSGLLDLYMSSVSNRMNEVMKVLTIMASIFIPLTFIAGVYGMNFEYMPELKWRWAYPAVWMLMGATVVGMILYFRKKRWF
ncbi:MAG: magnesium and cobalt transport protein CorA [Desulfuromonas sp.]|nr:MAG: magnesium and cobalt transport protein CorA [Desulfuromonas sp.]